MPAPAQPKPKPPAPPNAVKVAGTQEQFQAAGDALAKALGWFGEPDWETAGIKVSDAWNYIVKTLHENFIAGALGHELPDYMAACEHLGITDPAEQKLFQDAASKAYEEGKGSEVTEVAGKTLSMGAALVQGKVG